jgi:hypothetical protein
MAIGVSTAPAVIFGIVFATLVVTQAPKLRAPRE